MLPLPQHVNTEETDQHSGNNSNSAVDHHYDINYISVKPDEKTLVIPDEKFPALIHEDKQLVRRRRTIKHYLCCICCPCLPMWARYSCCTLFLLFIIFLIIVGVLVAIFKVPVVEFNGPTKHPAGIPAFQKYNDSLAFEVNFGLKIGVINDNVESITFESIKAIAYYPTAPKVPVGGGEIYDVNIKSYGISNFTFPFSIKYDPTKDEGFAMLADIATKCGLLGAATKEDLYIQYDVIPTLRIAGIAISPTIHQSSHFPCPISTDQLSMGLENSGEILGDEKEKED